MAHLIALEFNDNDILVAAGRAQGRRIQLTNLLSIEIPESEDASSLGELLRQELHRARIPRGNVITVVHRQQVEMRELTLPPAPDHELPAMVRFQARNVFATMNEQWALDFVKQTAPDDAPQSLRVLAAAISPETIHRTEAIVDAAGLKLQRIVFRPYAIEPLLPKDALGDDQVRLVVDPCDEQVDLTLLRGEQMLGTRSVRVPAGYELADIAPRLVNEVRRTLVSLGTGSPGNSLTEILIFGEPDRLAPLHDALHTALDRPIQFIDPLKQVSLSGSIQRSQPTAPEAYASLIGALIGEARDKNPPIDFLHPKQPLETNGSRSKTYLYGGLAAGLGICLLVLGWWLLKNEDRRIEELTRQLEDIQRINEGEGQRPGIEQIIGEVTLIDQWQEKNIDWLEELYQLSDRMLTADDVILDSLLLSAGDRGVSLTMSGRLAETDRGTELAQRLADRPYRVQGPRYKELQETAEYKYKFDNVLRLETDLAEVAQQINERARDRAAHGNDPPPATASVPPYPSTTQE